MDELIDMVLKNPFLLIIVIGGIISLLKGKSGKPEEETRQPASNPKPVNSRVERTRTEHKRPDRTPVEQTVKTLTVEDHRREKMQRLSEQMAANEHQSMVGRPKVADATRELQVNKLSSRYNQEQFQKQFKGNLTSKGLVDSIVMAEVLGAPRAKQKYQSVISKRRQIK